MKLTLTILSTAFILAQSAWAHDPPPGTVAIAKATELGVHRIERLVTLKKIDPMFQTNLLSMRAERSTENGATYKITAYTQPDANRQSSSVVILAVAANEVGPTHFVY